MAEQDTDFDFCEDKPRQFKNLTVGGKQYILREPSEEAARLYRNANLKTQRMVDDKFSMSMEGAADSQSILVAACLFEVSPDGKDSRVSLTWLRDNISSKRLKAMFEWLREVGDLREGAATVEAIDKQIERLQSQKAKLAGGGDQAKN